jgi:hypothetical protein
LILVDTSIWIDHLRAEDPHWTSLLADGEVLVRPMVIGELAGGNLRHREQVIMDLQDLLASPVETNDEALLFPQRLSIDGTRNRVHRHSLAGGDGIGEYRPPVDRRQAPAKRRDRTGPGLLAVRQELAPLPQVTTGRTSGCLSNSKYSFVIVELEEVVVQKRPRVVEFVPVDRGGDL